MRGELAEQVVDFTFAADYVDGIIVGEYGAEDLVGDEFGQSVGDTDMEAHGLRGGAPLDCVTQFVA